MRQRTTHRAVVTLGVVMCRGLSVPKAEAGARLSMAEVMTNGSGSKLADVFQQVVIFSFGQLALPQLCYQLHNGFVVFGYFLQKGWEAAEIPAEICSIW